MYALLTSLDPHMLQMASPQTQLAPLPPQSKIQDQEEPGSSCNASSHSADM